jgi:hypothetical protein
VEVALLIALAAAINKTVSVVKAVLNGDVNTTVTQLVVWLVGFLGLSLAAHASVTSGLEIPGLSTTLGLLDWPSVVLLAWILGSTGSFGYDALQAIDNTGSAVEPKLLAKIQPAPAQEA